MSPKTMITDIDDIVQIRDKWEDLLALMAKLGFTREETAGVVGSWLEMLIEREE